MDRRVERRKARSGRKTAGGVGEAHRGGDGPLAVEMRSRDLGSIPAHLTFPNTVYSPSRCAARPSSMEKEEPPLSGSDLISGELE